MATAKANGIEIAYETFGQRSDRPLLLIIGLATQMVGWPTEFCRQLAAAGHWVVRFDNRDIGRSTKMTALEVPDLNQLMKALENGQSVQSPYSLSDMAADTAGLMDALGLPAAHICGMSMGGMIGQIMAIEMPQRVTSLISMMSTTGEIDLPPSTPAAQQAMLSTPPSGRAAYQQYLAELCRVFANDSPAFDAELQKTMAGQAFDRGMYPLGFVRQMAAILAAHGRRKALGTVRTPALVIHGTHDTVAPPAHGQDTARAIPGARLLMIEGLGHGLAFPSLWPEMISAIARHTAGAEKRFDGINQP